MTNQRGIAMGGQNFGDGGDTGAYNRFTSQIAQRLDTETNSSVLRELHDMARNMHPGVFAQVIGDIDRKEIPGLGHDVSICPNGDILFVRNVQQPAGMIRAPREGPPPVVVRPIPPFEPDYDEPPYHGTNPPYDGRRDRRYEHGRDPGRVPEYGPPLDPPEPPVERGNNPHVDCEPSDENTHTGAVVGSVIGAVAGGVIAHQGEKNDTPIGIIAGGVLGGIIGNEVDKANNNRRNRR